MFVREPNVRSQPGITHGLIPARRGFPSPLAVAVPSTDHLDPDIKVPETKMKAGKERWVKKSDDVKTKLCMHPG